MSTLTFDIIKDAAADATAVPAGTAATYLPGGDEIQNGLFMVDSTVSDLRLQPYLALKTRKSQYQNGVFSKYLRKFSHAVPRLRANGLYTYDFVRIEIEISPETPIADAVAQEQAAAQLLYIAGLSNFRRSGVL